MFFKKRVKETASLDKVLIDTEPQRRVLKAIIDGKLYDTLKAEEICSLILHREDIPNYNSIVCYLGGQEVIVYKGNVEWFIVYFYTLQPVSEEWVKEMLGKHNVEKYIELYGEPELA